MKTFKNLFLPVLLAGFLIISCKKEKNPDPTPDPDPTPTLFDRQKDSAVGYSKSIYLWDTQIPESFSGKSYSSLNDIMVALRQYSKEPGFTKPVDRWSFAVLKSEWDAVSSGEAKDYGLEIFFWGASDLRVKNVEPNSPAGQAGIRRGWKITKVNGSTNINTSDASIDFLVNAIYENTSSVVIEFEKHDNTTQSITLNGAAYQANPFVRDSVYSVGGKNVGYMVYNSFLGDSAQASNNFQRIFNRFQTNGVNEVIVDLRYNGGGYVAYQEELANYLVPAAGNGQTMMTQTFNSTYSSWNETTKFSKKGNLNLSRIFFIITENTASASELLINNLTPFMSDVVIVGRDSSYGKPVGYFPIPVGQWYIFPVSYRSTNKDGQGNYFYGFIPDSRVPDGVNKDWGDKTESSLASALKFIETGTFRRPTASESFTEDPKMVNSNHKLDANIPLDFKGMVDNKQRF